MEARSCLFKIRLYNIKKLEPNHIVKSFSECMAIYLLGIKRIRMINQIICELLRWQSYTRQINYSNLLQRKCKTVYYTSWQFSFVLSCFSDRNFMYCLVSSSGRLHLISSGGTSGSCEALSWNNIYLLLVLLIKSAQMCIGIGQVKITCKEK